MAWKRGTSFSMLIACNDATTLRTQRNEKRKAAKRFSGNKNEAIVRKSDKERKGKRTGISILP